MTLLAAIPTQGRAHSLIAAARRAGYRCAMRGDWLQVYDAPPLTPGDRRTPRKRSADVSDRIAQPWAEKLNQEAMEAQKESSRMAACKTNRLRAEARRNAAMAAKGE